jgi:hypothetical protein
MRSVPIIVYIFREINDKDTHFSPDRYVAASLLTGFLTRNDIQMLFFYKSRGAELTYLSIYLNFLWAVDSLDVHCP